MAPPPTRSRRAWWWANRAGARRWRPHKGLARCNQTRTTPATTCSLSRGPWAAGLATTDLLTQKQTNKPCFLVIKTNKTKSNRVFYNKAPRVFFADTGALPQTRRRVASSAARWLAAASGPGKARQPATSRTAWPGCTPTRARRQEAVRLARLVRHLHRRRRRRHRRRRR